MVVEDDAEKANELNIYLLMNKESYADYLKAFGTGRNQITKEDVEYWLSYIGLEAELRYQNKVIYGMLIFYDEYKEMPTGFDSKYVKYISEKGVYEVIIPIVQFDTADNEFGFRWYE